MGLVRRLCRERSLAVLATIHDLTLAALYCDRLVLLHRGAVVAEGTPESVLRPELVAATYGADVTVLRHPISGRPVVVPNPGTVEQWNSGAEREAWQPSAADATSTARPSRPTDGGDGAQEGGA
jgi:ABC-type multidrug transport system ATPase subunit